METVEHPISSTRDGFARALICLAVLSGLILRWMQLGRASLWFDEGYSAWIASLPAGKIVRALRNDTSPPLYYLLLRAWTIAFGRSETALRSLSALCSTATLICFYALAMRLLRDRLAAAAAMLLLAVSVMQVAYAHEARFYSMLTLLAEADVLAVLWLIDSPKTWKYLFAIVAWVASLYTSNMMIVYLACLCPAWLLCPGFQSWKNRLRDLTIVGTAAGLVYLPWLPTMLAQSRSLRGEFWIERPSLESLIRAIAVLAGVNQNGVGGWGLGSISYVCLGFLLVIAVGFIFQSTRRTAAALSTFGLLPVGAVFIYSQYHQPIFVDRAFVPTTLVTPLLIALPLTVRFRTSLPVPIAALALGVLSLRGNYLGEHPENWREICRLVDSKPPNHRLIVFAANEGELLYDYYSRNGDYHPASNLTGAPADFFAIDPPRTMRRVQSDQDLQSLRDLIAANAFDEIDLVESHFWWSDPHRHTFAFLSGNFHMIEKSEIDNIFVYRFAAAPVPVQ